MAPGGLALGRDPRHPPCTCQGCLAAWTPTSPKPCPPGSTASAPARSAWWPIAGATIRRSCGRFTLALQDILAAVTPQTRILVVNSPSNPTGWVMPLAEMEALRDVARERGLWILSDEVYNHFTYGNAIAPSFLQVTTPTDRLIVTNTFSKNWAMTGWRAGWVTYPEGLAATFSKLGQYNTTSIPTFIQHAAVAALEQGDAFIRTMVGRCVESRAILVEGLSRIRGVTVFPPEGAFYLMVRVDTGETSLDLAFRLLREAKVGVAPGTAFGPQGEGFLRICFAISPELAREAVARLARVLSTPV
ncbi:aminotransferase class I/II-fold pyridoxal phosphate-dependent enzyme [Belnapia mucosa]|uniref:aminotransferase class I/II-fold pyridoxal phosphate-dependent enzyme n=1 Tax=Belnapia mucosa TaxID=2804532 RepID=UPI002E28F315|nr:aminotransferase class I/II-fold pyridoxal phosphate-dependent enzyme [Belnapia mucosa]